LAVSTPPNDISTSAIASTDRYSAPIDMLSATPDYMEKDPTTAVVREHMQYHDKKAASETCHAIYSIMHA